MQPCTRANPASPAATRSRRPSIISVDASRRFPGARKRGPEFDKYRGGAPTGVRPASLGAGRRVMASRRAASWHASRCGDPHLRLSALCPLASRGTFCRRPPMRRKAKRAAQRWLLRWSIGQLHMKHGCLGSHPGRAPSGARAGTQVSLRQPLDRRILTAIPDTWGPGLQRTTSCCAAPGMTAEIFAKDMRLPAHARGEAAQVALSRFTGSNSLVSALSRVLSSQSRFGKATR